MLSILMYFAIATGIIVLIFGILYKPLVSVWSEKSAIKSEVPLLRLLVKATSKAVIRRPLEFIAKDKNFFLNKFAGKLLELCEAGISLVHLYFIKFALMLFLTVVLLLVAVTDNNYKIRLIIEASETQSKEFQETNTESSKYTLYKQISEHLKQEAFLKATPQERMKLVEESVAECINTTDQQVLIANAEWFISIREQVDRLTVFKPIYLIFLTVAFFSPELFLAGLWLVRGSVYKKEIIKLEYIFELLARVEGVKTLDIINQLEKSSKIYSKYLHEFSQYFKYDKARAFEYLKSRNVKSLSRLANVFEVYSLTDSTIALQILEREVIERDEAVLITADETIDFIDLVAFLSIAPLVYELARMMLNPMLELVYKAFEFV